MVLFGCVLPLESQEKFALISKSSGQDEEMGLLRSNHQERPEQFLVRLNAHEIKLARSYIANQMQWVKDFYEASMKNPQLAKTEAEQIAHRQQGMRAILDHIDSKIKEEDGKKYGYHCVNCINPCYVEHENEIVNICKTVVLIGGSILGVSTGFAFFLVNYPLKAEGCALLNRAAFMQKCMGDSIRYNYPFNATKMAEEYGEDNYQQQALDPACLDLAYQECKRLADRYNSHEYPKLVLKAFAPALIGVPALVATCVACQLVSCKYRRWKKSSNRLRNYAIQANDDMDAKITQTQSALSKHKVEESLNAVDC